MPCCGLTVNSQDNPVFARVFVDRVTRYSVADWTIAKVFHRISLSRSIDSVTVASASVFSPHGQVYDTSNRRGARPRVARALVQSGRATAGISHRIVRDRPLAPLSQRNGIPRKYQGGQVRGGDLARSVDARGCRPQSRSICPGSPEQLQRCRATSHRAITACGLRHRRCDFQPSWRRARRLRSPRSINLLSSPICRPSNWRWISFHSRRGRRPRSRRAIRSSATRCKSQPTRKRHPSRLARARTSG